MIWPCVPAPLYLYQCAAIVESGQGWAGPELHLAVTLAPPPPPVPPFHQHVNTNITATFLRDLSSNKNVKKIIWLPFWARSQTVSGAITGQGQYNRYHAICVSKLIWYKAFGAEINCPGNYFRFTSRKCASKTFFLRCNLSIFLKFSRKLYQLNYLLLS